MKRILACSLAIILVLAALFSVSATAENISFNATLCNAVDQTSSKWYQTSEMRCAFALLIMADLASSTSANFEFEDWDWSKPCAVAKMNSSIVLIMQTKTDMYIIGYTPLSGEAVYTLTSDSTIDSELIFEAVIESIDDIDRFDILDIEELADVAGQLAELL